MTEFSRYIPDESLPKAFLVDIDGTIAIRGKRGPFDWKRVGEDTPNEGVIRVIKNLSLDYKMIYLSGRSEECFDETLVWLENHMKQTDIELHMRGEGDFRKDSIVKHEIFTELVEPRYNVLGVFDDRDQVVAMWRELGLTCFQVAYGDF